METHLVLTLSGTEVSSDELRSLHAWLLEEDELRGCVETRERPPAAGRLGPALEALRIVADPAAGVLTATLVAWLKSRVGRVRLVLRPGNGDSVELDASHVRGLDADSLTELTDHITHLLITDAGADPHSGAADAPAGGQVTKGDTAQGGDERTALDADVER